MLKQKILFTNEECDDIIKNHINLPMQRKPHGSNGDYSYINVDYQKYKWIVDRVITWIENEEGCKLDFLESSQDEFYFQSYGIGDKFPKHHDSAYDRFYNFGLLLNNSFDGGEFSVDISEKESVLFNNTIGNCYFFESYKKHEQKEIISGNRHIILIFFHKKNVKFNQSKLI